MRGSSAETAPHLNIADVPKAVRSQHRRPASHDDLVCLLVDELAEDCELGSAWLPGAQVIEATLREVVAGFDDTRLRLIKEPMARLRRAFTVDG